MPKPRGMAFKVMVPKMKEMMKRKRIILWLLVLITGIALVSCHSKEPFGRRKAPRNCHSCTRWSK